MPPFAGTFERAEGFDLPRYWSTYLDHFDQRRHHDSAVVRLSRAGLDRLGDLMEPAVVRAARETAGSPDPDGWTEVGIPIESVERALPELLKLGADAEIVAPAELREQLTRTLAAMNRGYGLA